MKTDDLHKLAQFLKDRRAKVRPEDVGLARGNRRRTPGLRREEVAQLADISVEWYKWLEQARDVRASAKTLERIGNALRLEPIETRYLLRLSGHMTDESVPLAESEGVSKRLQRVLDELSPCPAYIHGRRWDVLAWNDAAELVLGDLQALKGIERNCLHMGLLGPLRNRIPDWEEHATGLIAAFRANYARYRGESLFEELILTLSQQSTEFARWWAEPTVRGWRDGIKHFRHPHLGELAFEHSGFDLADERLSSLRLVTMLPAEGTDTRARLISALGDYQI
ncbi:helix-turn-helix transcriptional regulator [Billgrantia pellis]|uniref:helix-turn-helix transcriptional regulator n=1 Tax=Billgrantia pellis TaxID=2606936 RepID=UPI001659B67C|nr:helix-turn-helix transcriptional regulator [Halomonas pellis]